MKKTNEIPDVGQMILITARNCSDKVQPLLRSGKSYYVKGKETDKEDGHTTLILSHPVRHGSTLRCSELRFQWKILTEDVMREQKLRAECHRMGEIYQRDFTYREQMDVVFVPLIYNYISWSYARKSRRMAADERIELLKKLGRAFDHAETEYQRDLARDLDSHHIASIGIEAERFMKKHEANFDVLYHNVRTIFRNLFPTYPYHDLRINAIMAMLIIRLTDAHNRRMEDLVAQRMKMPQRSHRMEKMDTLYTIADAYAGEVGKFPMDDKQIQMCLNIIENMSSDIMLQL